MNWIGWIRGLASPGEKHDDERAAYRKCPACGERNFRMTDRQRQSPHVYRSRIFSVKWLCLTCGHRENETVEES